jgi:S1-C subfamily serine protease
LCAGLALACDAPDRRLPIPPNLLEDERNTIEIFRRTAASVVFVTNSEVRRSAFNLNATQATRGTGSGFVWDRQGHIVTNFHVVEGGNRFSVTLADGSVLEARLVGVAPRKDLAVLAIDAEDLSVGALEPGDSTNLAVGQKVLAIGNPFGLDSSLTTGVISALGREIQSVAGTLIEDVIQTDAAINPGSSGGPLLDSSGRLIGVNTGIFSSTGSSSGVSFAVPVATVARLVPQLIAYGRVKWPGLGITALPDHIAASWGVVGVIVRDILPNSPAERAGLHGIRSTARGGRSFDLITEVGGRPIRRAIDLIDALDDHDPGDVVAVRFLREGRVWEANVELGELK